MSIDFEDQLRAEMGRVQVRPRPGLAREAHRRYARSRRRTAFAVAATGTAAAVAGATAGFALTAGTPGTGPIETTASGQLDLTESLFVPQSVINNNGYYQSPVIPWQYTMNVAAFYEMGNYTFTFSVYNLTDQLNWQSAPAFYGNDFLVRNDPRTFEFRVQAKF